VQRYPVGRPAGSASRTRRLVRQPTPAGFGEFSGRVVQGEAAGWTALLDLLVAVLHWSIALVAAPFGIALCMAGVRDWPVTARRLGRSHRIHQWHVHGRTASNELLAEIVDALLSGRHLPEGDAELH
jgi:hypothetical protein